MVIAVSTAVQNARLNSVEQTIGTGARLRIRSGAAPLNTMAADTGTVLATIELPNDWMGDASGGVKSMSGTWADASADAGGNAGHYRIYDSAGVCHLQGSVGASGSMADMTVDNIVFAAGQSFQVVSYVWNDGNG